MLNFFCFHLPLGSSTAVFKKVFFTQNYLNRVQAFKIYYIIEAWKRIEELLPLNYVQVIKSLFQQSMRATILLNQNTTISYYYNKIKIIEQNKLWYNCNKKIINTKKELLMLFGKFLDLFFGPFLFSPLLKTNFFQNDIHRWLAAALRMLGIDSVIKTYLHVGCGFRSF